MKKTILLLLSLVVVSCGGEDEPTVEQQVQAQVAAGATLYTANCAGCHGAMGQGTAMGPAVVGSEAFPKMPRAGAVRDVTFSTALDVFQWAKPNMPANAPGSMSDEDLLAIFAFDLDANGVTLERPLDAALAMSIVLNP